MNDEEKINHIREHLPATRHVAYLNTGTAGPLPLGTAGAMRAAAERELTEGRISPAVAQMAGEARGRARAVVAGILGASPEEIALTHFTTEGINVAIWGIDWQPGDEILATNLEHPAVFLPALTVAQRFGVRVKFADLGLGGGDAAGAMAEAITPRTRLVVLSHVTYCTGAVLPVAEITAAAHSQGALVLVDGAQSVGAMPVNVAELGVDFYSVPGQKWLCGPEDTGALFVRRDRLDLLQQTFIGYASMAQYAFEGPLVPHPDARRYEVGSRHTPSIVGQATSAEWLRDEVGLSWAIERIRRLTAHAREALGAIPGVTILTPANCAGLLSFGVAGVDPEALARRLAAAGIVIRSIKVPRCTRASLGFFNTEEDIARLAAAVKRESVAS